MKKHEVTTARTRAARTDFYVEVDDATMRDLIANDRVNVQRSGSLRKNKDGSVRDYRGKYVAIRERAGRRRVLAFGILEKMTEYLANRLNVFFCQNCQNVSIEPCAVCQNAEAKAADRAYLM